VTPASLPSAFDLDSQTLRAIAAISEYGSVTRAAAVLGQSQPALSQHLRRVEARIGMPLVARVGRGIRLTDAGDVLVRHAGVVLAALEEASGELSDLAGLRAGRVRLAGFPSASSTIVPRLIREMGEKHPGVRVTYLEAEPPEAVASVRDGASDLAIAFRHPDDPDDPFEGSADGLDVQELARDEVLLLIRDDHPVLRGATGGSVDLAALRTDDWIAGCPRCRGHLLASCARAGFAPNISFETDNVTAVAGMVRAGLGVALLPQLAVTSAALPSGVVARRTAAGDHRLLVVVTRPGARAIPAVDASLGFLPRCLP
jgi:DNA-binding transcriptional LysR family regulator